MLSVGLVLADPVSMWQAIAPCRACLGPGPGLQPPPPPALRPSQRNQLENQGRRGVFLHMRAHSWVHHSVWTFLETSMGAEGLCVWNWAACPAGRGLLPSLALLLSG